MCIRDRTSISHRGAMALCKLLAALAVHSQPCLQRLGRLIACQVFECLQGSPSVGGDRAVTGR
eukprot:4615779-Alexandrium_andersonii.AAC.1